MAGDWVPIGAKTPRCEEVVRIAVKSRRSRRETVGILVDFWIWVVHQTPDGFLRGYSLESLEIAIEGTDAAFWEAVADEGWVEVHDDGLRIPENKETPFIEKGSRARLLKARRDAEYKAKRDAETATCATTEATYGASTCASTGTATKAPRNAPPTETETETDSVLSSNTRSEPSKESIREAGPRRSDLLVSEETLARSMPQIASLFKRACYSGKDGLFFWKLGCLVELGVVPESIAHAACNGAGMNARNNAVGFAQIAAVEECSKAGLDLKAILGAMRMPRLANKGPPQVSRPKMASSLGDSLTRKG